MTATAPRETLRETLPPVAAARQRGDIQGLRALAVGLVLVYHLRPAWLPGGFTGVDVFFVISGFLIIGMLAGELRRTGTIRLREFYARRIRRLLPAASAVLLLTVVATWAILPMSRWPDTMGEIVTSALNVQNWALAIRAADYTAATAAASPVQHFWSLSVEEQFYLVIPVLLLLARRFRPGRATRSAMVAVAVVTVASFGFSVVFGAIDHGRAYFVTPTRMWELGLGGLVALVAGRLRLGRPARLVCGWGGLAAVAVGAAVLTTDMAFPGYVALLPVLGAAGMLVAGIVPAGEEVAAAETASVLGVRPLRYLGDISYSLYLWHWPVIVVILQLDGRSELTRRQMVLALALSIAMAALSKRFIEDPFRRGSAVRRPRTAYLLGATLVAVTVLSTIVPARYAEAELDRLTSATVLDENHPGALAFDPEQPKPVPSAVALMPDPAVAGHDYPLNDRPGCSVYDVTEPPPSVDACTYGPADAPKTIVLVGDSHAAMYATVFAEFTRTHPGWRVKMFLRNGCPFTATAPAGLSACSDQGRAVLAEILALKPVLVVTAAMSPESYDKDLHWRWDSRAQAVDGYESLLRPISDAGIRVGVLREVPRPAQNTPRCLESHPDPTGCDTPRDQAFGPDDDPLAEAAQRVPRVTVVDLTPWLCSPDTCPAVVGNVVVYRDNHLTDTYVRTLYRPLITRLGLA